MPLEAEARQEIDRQLAACGWAVQDYSALNLAAAPGIAVREFPLTAGEVDYLLYIEGKAAGVVEAPQVGERAVADLLAERRLRAGERRGLAEHHGARGHALGARRRAGEQQEQGRKDLSHGCYHRFPIFTTARRGTHACC